MRTCDFKYSIINNKKNIYPILCWNFQNDVVFFIYYLDFITHRIKEYNMFRTHSG